MRFETLAVHAGRRPEAETGSVAPPIYLSTTFERGETGAPLGGYTYIRESNPMQTLLEEALAPLEGGEAALVLGSGMAAGVAVFQALPRGAHVLLPDDAYYGWRSVGQEFFPAWGLTASFCPMDDLAAVRRALTPATKLVLVESPSNPLLKVADLAGIAALAKAAGALTLVDNTFATPALQRPLDLGADVALHSATKYFGGHSDVQGGALVFRRKDDLYARVVARAAPARGGPRAVQRVARPARAALARGEDAGAQRERARGRPRARGAPARRARELPGPRRRTPATPSRRGRCPASAGCSPST